MMDALRHLLLVVDHGTITAAARRAHLSQPALTASIQRLELDLGARLLDRDRRGARPTAAGEALLPRARAALAAIEDGRRAVAEVLGLRAGEVRLGAGATACTYLLPPVVAAFRAAHPGVRFSVREATTVDVLAALEAGRLDLGLVTPPPGARLPDAEPWYDDELVLVRAPGAPAGLRDVVTLGPGSTTRDLLARHFPDATVVMELGSIAAVKGNVRAGVGIALVSRSAVAADLAARRLVLVKDPRTPIRRPLVLVHRGVASLPPAATELRRLLLSARPDPRRAARRGARRRRG